MLVATVELPRGRPNHSVDTQHVAFQMAILPEIGFYVKVHCFRYKINHFSTSTLHPCPACDARYILPPCFVS